MRLVVVGSSGSCAGPDAAASCYLVTADDAAGRTWRVVLDLGSGSFGPLQRLSPPTTIDALCLTHLHHDHCADLAGLYVYARHRPDGPLAPIPLYGPPGTDRRVAELRGVGFRPAPALHVVPSPDDDPAADAAGPPRPVGVFAHETWEDGSPVRIGPFLITPFRIEHPGQAYGLRVVGPSESGKSAVTLAYSGDSDECVGLETLAAGCDLLLAEASFLESDAVVPGLHLTALRAGGLAERAGAGGLVLTHLPPWANPADAVREAALAYPGPIALAVPGASFAI